MWRPSSDAAGHRSIVWRDTLLPLKQGLKVHGILPAGQVISALEALVAQPNSTVVKEHEVSEDLCFLAQLLRTLQTQGHSAGRGEVLFCRLVASALHGRRVVMQPAAANIVCSALRCWADNSDESDASGDRQLQVEALHALAALLQDNVAQVAAHEQTAVLALLYALAQGSASPMASPASGARRVRPSEPIEVRRQALHALAACCPSKPGGPGLPPERLPEALHCAVQALASATEDRRPVEDAATSKYLATLVKTLASMVQVGGRAWVPHTGTIVDGLCCLMTYGLSASIDARAAAAAASAAASVATASLPSAVRPAASAGVTGTALTQPKSQGPSSGPTPSITTPSGASAPATAGAQSAAAPVPAVAASSASAGGGASAATAGAQPLPVKGRYLPPHLRAAAAAAAAGAPSSVNPSPSPAFALGPGQRAAGRPSASPRSAAGPSPHSEAGSDGEDAADSSRLEVDRLKSSRIRLGLLQCLQTMAKSDSRALHQHWTTLLPTTAHLQPRPAAPNLATMLLFDTVAKVRSMAAATMACLLEGPQQRAYLAMAEARNMLPTQTTSAPPQPPQARAGFKGPTLNPVLGQRGFTTLSVSLGHMVLALHHCLLHAARSDLNISVVQVALRSLCCLMAGAPYDRLPAPLLPEVLDGLWSCWLQRQMSTANSGGASPAGRWRTAAPAPILLPQDLASGAVPASELLTVQAACLACLAEGLLTKVPVQGLASHLKSQIEAGQSAAAQGQVQAEATGLEAAQLQAAGQKTAQAASGGLRSYQQPLSAGQAKGEALPLVSELLACCFNRNAVIRVEALAALRGLASNYPFVLQPNAKVSDLAAGPGASTGRSGEDGSGGSCWDATLAAVHLSLECSALAGAGPVRPAFSPRRSSQSGGAAGAGGSGAASGRAAAAAVVGAETTTVSASTSPDDKAAQHAVQLLAASLRAQALQLGLRVDPESDLGEMPEPGGPPSSLAATAVGPLVPQSQADVATLVGAASAEDVTAGQQAALGQGEALAPRWQEAQQLLVPLASGSHSYMVRSAALAALAALPEPVGARLPAGSQQSLLVLLAQAAETDAAAATRSMACKVLGVLLTHAWVLHTACASDGSSATASAPSQAAAAPAAAVAVGSVGTVAGQPCSSQALLLRCIDSLVRGLGDSTLSVRISAAWAVANICDALKCMYLQPWQQQQQQQQQQQHQEAANGIVAGSEPSTSSGDTSGGARSGCILPAALPAWLYEPLEATVLQAVQDTDKVRCSGVRGLGSLLALDCTVGHYASTTGDVSGGGGGGAAGNDAVVERGLLLERALPGLQSCLTTGNMKVQWNACYAAQELLLHVAALVEQDGFGPGEAGAAGGGHGASGLGGGGFAAGLVGPHARLLLVARLAPLLLLLVMLTRDSSNFKIRMHAAAALSAPRRRWVYGDSYPDAVLVTCAALEGQEDSTPGPSAGSESSGNTAGTAHGSGTVGGARRSTGRPKGQAGAEAGAADSDATFPNYRYAAGLSQQLGATLLHLLSLAEDADGARLREALVKRAEVLQRTLLSAAEAAVAATGLWGSVAAARDAELEAVAGRAQLPVDPFELRPDAAAVSSPSAAAQAEAGAGQPLQQGGLAFGRLLSQALEVAAKLQPGDQGGAAAAAATGPSVGGAAGAEAQLHAVVAALRGAERLVQGAERQRVAVQRNGQAWALLAEVVQLAAPLEQWALMAAQRL